MISNHKDHVAAVLIVPPKSPKLKTMQFMKEQLLIMGLKSFMLNGLSYIKESVAIKMGVSDKSIERIAKSKDIPVYKFKSVNDEALFALLKKIKPDIVLTQVPEIIKPNLLKTAKMGFINKHASLLPKYRGKHPIFWALLNGEKQIGYTLHLMDEGVDTGKALLQRKINVQQNDSISSLYKKVFIKAGLDLSSLISKINNNSRVVRLKIISHRGYKGKYFSTPTSEDAKKFKALGLKY